MEYRIDARRIFSGHDNITEDECQQNDDCYKNGMVAVYADKRVVSHIERDGYDLVVTTSLGENDNLVFWVDGWLYQSKPNQPANGGKALHWQAMPLDGISHALATPGLWKSWGV